ncbi:hypothetical protein Q3G72_035022 [Acer saccharum]|nr:hypothetical protein Q3G72_035022 [Acer saccharum]
MDARNGKILWSIADPSNALAFGPVTLANGVLLAGSTHGKGPIYAMNAKREKFCGSTTLEEWRRYANKEKKISHEAMAKLQLKWKFYAGGDISVTPAIFNDTIYFPTWNGNLNAVKASDVSLVWRKNLQKLTGFNNTGFVLSVNSTVSRSTPTIAGDLLLAVVIVVKRSNGNLVWSTKLDDHARGFITMSGTYYKGATIYGGGSVSNGCIYMKRSAINRTTPSGKSVLVSQ